MNKRILIVEDDPELARTLKAKFQASGYNCTVAYDGKEAFDQIENEKYKLIILDLVMPKMDGFEFLEKYRDAFPPIFVLTNLSDDEAREKALKLGANKYIIKSDTSIEKILSFVKEVMDEKGSNHS